MTAGDFIGWTDEPNFIGVISINRTNGNGSYARPVPTNASGSYVFPTIGSTIYRFNPVESQFMASIAVQIDPSEHHT